MSKVSFNFQENPDKSISAGTKKIYKQKLNVLARSVNVLNKEDILNNSKEVAEYINGLTNKQGRNLSLAAIFYAIGRQDFERDPRGYPIYQAFQDNYKKKDTVEDADT